MPGSMNCHGAFSFVTLELGLFAGGRYRRGGDCAFVNLPLLGWDTSATSGAFVATATADLLPERPGK